MANQQPDNAMTQVQAQLLQLQNELQTVRTANTNLATQLSTLQASAGNAAPAPAAAQAPTFAEA